MSSAIPDPYAVLGVDRDQADDGRAVRQAYRREALRWHPDRALPERKQESEHRFKEVSQSFEILSDPTLRRAYDERVARDEYERGVAANRAQQQQQHDAWGGWGSRPMHQQQQQQQQQHPFFRQQAQHPFSSFFGQQPSGLGGGWNPFGFPPSHGFAAPRPSADPFGFFEEMAAGPRGANSIFAQHARMMDDLNAQGFAGEGGGRTDSRSSPMDDFFRDFEEEVARERTPRQEGFSQQNPQGTRERDQEWDRTPVSSSHNMHRNPRVQEVEEVPDLGRLFAHVGSSLLSALPGLVDLALGSFAAHHDSGYNDQNNDNRTQSSFSSFRSSSTSNNSGNGPAGLVSESEETRIVNGRRQTVRRKVDAEGNETVEVVHNDGRRTVSVKGLPESGDASSRRERIIEL
ncbi:hypothetical protein CF319_g2381 [Tilletia indica]|nr:hypothetical protein CF319_g2381 [Tilletia indica]